ncbi:MAG: nucleotidyltransferase family protein [Burkholderiales bacterium]|nr:nucleotidyltransferase family protein [Burkholderiales bacterium]
MPEPSHLCGILLAAGSGSRFGGGKLAHPLPASGVPLVVAAWRHLKAAVPQSCAVVRAGDAAVIALLRAEGARVIECDDAAEGMGRSLSCGVRANPYAAGWIVALGDMPTLRIETIAAVARSLRQGAAIAIPVRDGQRGHPVGFAVRFGAELSELRGDAGARSVLKAHATDVTEVHVDDPGILADVDTRADLARVAS